MADDTEMLRFMQCGNTDHHSIVLAREPSTTLNHIAFEMPDLDSVMRGAGRMKDNGYPIEWGVGRHGAGNNVFAYFAGPDEFPLEYTAEVMQVDDSYVVHGPDYWRFPPRSFRPMGRDGATLCAAACGYGRCRASARTAGDCRRRDNAGHILKQRRRAMPTSSARDIAACGVACAFVSSTPRRRDEATKLGLDLIPLNGVTDRLERNPRDARSYGRWSSRRQAPARCAGSRRPKPHPLQP